MRKFVSPYGATTRRNVVLLLLFLFAAIVLGRVVYLQVYHAEFLVKQGNNRFVRIKKEPAIRGSILDRNAVPLAVSTPVSSLWVNPKELLESPQSVSALSSAIGYPLTKLQQKLAQKKHAAFMYLQRGMEPAIATKVLDKKFPGVYALREYRRYYPSGDVVSQVIGFNNIDDVGQEGVELLYNNWLSGTAGSSEIIRDPKGKIVDILEEIKPPVQGQNLMLTIDKRIQYLTYLSLLETAEKFGAKTATAVVLDAKTAEILAMVSVPSGNPNNAQEKKPSLVKNRAITDTFEPGSVMKPFVVASALEAGLVHPNTPIDTRPGLLKVGSQVIEDIHNYGNTDVRGVIKKSSNVGTCKIALRLPKSQLGAMYQSLGLGQSSQIEFPGEQKGTLHRLERLGDFEYCTNAFGYGLSTTALQLAQAYAVLANNGVKVPVSLIKREVPSSGKRIMSAKTATQIRQMLALAVGEEGTGSRATAGNYIRDYSVGGKTGTVHKVIDGAYSKDHYRSVFAGLAPVNRPQIVMVVMIDEPQGDKYYGGLVAAPVFAKVVGKALRIMGVPPDKVPEKSRSIIHASQTKKH